MSNSKTQRLRRQKRKTRREHEPPAYLDWAELCAIEASASTASYDGPEIPHYARLGYLAKDLRRAA